MHVLINSINSYTDHRSTIIIYTHIWSIYFVISSLLLALLMRRRVVNWLNAISKYHFVANSVHYVWNLFYFCFFFFSGLFDAQLSKTNMFSSAWHFEWLLTNWNIRMTPRGSWNTVKSYFTMFSVFIFVSYVFFSVFNT